MPPSIGINTPFFCRKLRKSYTISFFIGVHVSFIHLIKSSLIQYYSILSLYSLSLQYVMRYNKNLFRYYGLTFAKLSIFLSYIFRLISFSYFFRQVDAIIADIHKYIQQVSRGQIETCIRQLLNRSCQFYKSRINGVLYVKGRQDFGLQNLIDLPLKRQAI